MPVMTYRDALRSAMAEEMERDESVVLLGEDIGLYGGTHLVTNGLIDQFGPKRVIDTPIAEGGFTGAAIGMAMAGLRPIVEMMTWNFSFLAADQIIQTAAKLHYFSGGQVNVPLVIRGPNGGGVQLSSQHTHSLEGFYGHFPGLKVVSPATPADVKGMMLEAIRDPNPVIFLEAGALYGTKGEVPDGEFTVPFGKARIAREGDSWLRRGTAAAFYRVFRGTAEVPMPLDAGDFSLMDRNVVDALLSCPERDPFLRGLRAWVGFSQIGVDYVRPSRAFGRSTHSFLKNFWWAKKGIFSFSSAPIEFLGYGAAFLTLMSLVALVERGIALLREPDLTPGIGLVLAVVAFLGSLNLLAVALVGEYVLRILEEARGRPRFIRKGIRLGEQLLTTKSQMDAFLNERQHRRTALQRRIPETVDEDAG